MHADSYLGEIVSIAVSSRIVLVDIGFFGGAECFALVFVFDGFRRVIAIFFDGDDFRNNDIAIFDEGIFRYKSLVIDLVVIAELDSLGLGFIGFATDDFKTISSIFAVGVISA